jgi:hypothetical protein
MAVGVRSPPSFGVFSFFCIIKPFLRPKFSQDYGSGVEKLTPQTLGGPIPPWIFEFSILNIFSGIQMFCGLNNLDGSESGVNNLLLWNVGGLVNPGIKIKTPIISTKMSAKNLSR